MKKISMTMVLIMSLLMTAISVNAQILVVSKSTGMVMSRGDNFTVNEFGNYDVSNNGDITTFMSNHVDIYEGELPADYDTNKYMWNGFNFVPNPNYISPEQRAREYAAIENPYATPVPTPVPTPAEVNKTLPEVASEVAKSAVNKSEPTVTPAPTQAPAIQVPAQNPNTEPTSIYYPALTSGYYKLIDIITGDLIVTTTGIVDALPGSTTLRIRDGEGTPVPYPGLRIEYVPSTLLASKPTPVPATPVPVTPVPATPVPTTPVPATPVPATPVEASKKLPAVASEAAKSAVNKPEPKSEVTKIQGLKTETVKSEELKSATKEAYQVPTSKKISKKVTPIPAMNIYVNGTKIKNNMTVTKGKVVYVPIRVAQALGSVIDWNMETKEVILDDTVVLTIGSSDVGIEDGFAELDNPVLMIKGKTYVPLQFFTDMMGATAKMSGRILTIDK